MMYERSKQNRLNILLSVTALILISLTVVFTLSAVFKPTPKGNIVVNTVDTVLKRDGEIRALWIASVSNINFPSKTGLSATELKKEIDGILTTAENNSMNTIVFQVRPASDALYSSEIFPTSAYVVSKQGQAMPQGLDILEYLTTSAHKRGIAVCAWVNPLRVTTDTTDLNTLSESNPARLNPELTVSYNGALYYDPGQPKVRELVCHGVKEIADNYCVDAIVFDDYFYPYPVEGEDFNDSISYIKYGNSLSLEDWRRQNINSLVKAAYEAIDRKCYFGISPFGIWQNDNGSNGGSQTKGLCARDAIYCDALAWIEGGYIDFISPQIYWNFDHAAAPYAELTDWWDEKLRDTDIALIISHAAYKAPEWEDPYEISKQIEYARQKKSYLGAAIYGYAVIEENSADICEALARIY